MAGGALLSGALAIQTIRLSDASSQVEQFRREAAWPERPLPLGLDDPATQRFKKTVSDRIPESFWGEFAEDVHDCGSERSMLITARKIMTNETDRQDVERVAWNTPSRAVVTMRGSDALTTEFAMEMSDDRAEIDFVYTNLKRVVQRCSVRAHVPPETLKAPAASGMSESTVVGESFDADTNMAIDSPN